MPIDYKKAEKDLYQPKTTPSIIDVPEMTFIAVDSKGDPNTSEEYKVASDARRHHEIYLSDPRKTAPEKLKTVIRHPIATA